MSACRFVLIVPIFVFLGCGDDNGGQDAAMDLSVEDLSGADEAMPTTQRLARTNLVSDEADAGATTVDPNLVNAWGLAFNPSGPIWVAANHTGLETVYSSAGAILPLVVTVPPPSGGTPPAAPTGLVFNPTNTDFMGDVFIAATEDGTIAGWPGTGTTAVKRVDNSGNNAVYKGLALATKSSVSRLFATDFHNNKVVVFDQAYAPVTTTGGFTDPNLPSGFAPFGIQAIGSEIFVTYAKQDAMAHDDVKGVGNGFVDIFDFDGTLTKRLISNGVLNSPWGLAVAPSDYGTLANALFVGNFGDGLINAYDATNGTFLSGLQDTTGAPLAIDGLWALVFGNDTTGASHDQLFFTAGPDDENHGILGRLDKSP
jgi:uncharacterized protein (TIGR03118 family)